MISKTSCARRVLHLEPKTLKEQEKLRTRFEKLKGEAKRNLIADLQRKQARKSRRTEKEKEFVKALISRGTSFRNISPVWPPKKSFTKVSR